ncbi:MAG: hypothetical protein AAF228_13565 [Pseudomonadota bacterium]
MNRSILYILFIVILALIFVALLFFATKKPILSGQLPLEKIRITIDNIQKEELFTNLRKFAEKNAFAIRIAPTNPTEKNVSIQMWRMDAKIFGGNPFEENKFRFGIYETSPGFKIPLEHVNEIIQNFRSHIESIENSKFIVEKKN